MTETKCSPTPYAVPAPTTAECKLTTKINSSDSWNRARALSELKSHMQVAITIELATIPIYLSTYYSINRTPKSDKPKDWSFPSTELSRFADEAGALIMSVAVEEMLHMSLSSNILYSLGEDPQLYQQAPASYPAYLPGHAKNIKGASGNNARNIPIPLAKFSFEQLSHFLAIEYPALEDAIPEPGHWDTIGQIYSYVRCIIDSKYIKDEDFQVRDTQGANQIHATQYSPNNIDTVYPKRDFAYKDPIAPAQYPSATKVKDTSAASVAEYSSDENSHLGDAQLLRVNSCETALQAIGTICFQGEGFAQTSVDDKSGGEESHYYKFLSLQSKLNGYDSGYISQAGKSTNNVAVKPEAPKVPCTQYFPRDLSTFVFSTPDNPVASDFGEGRKELVDIADALFQYMLIMSETVYKIPSDKQKIYFNRTMHQSMIWVMDKLLQALRGIKCKNNINTLCATFANIDLGKREYAFATLSNMVLAFKRDYGTEPWYAQSTARQYLNPILELPDVSNYWSTAPSSSTPAYLDTPTSQQGKGSGLMSTPAKNKGEPKGKYAGTPKWPHHPPKDYELPEGALRHACMGLNSCENQGRTALNDCAGQGYCSTALSYNPKAPSIPSFLDHTCHVLNSCKSQGGCGLYGTEAEMNRPGHNECQSQGSCATPINAERFITDGENRGASVWQQARAVFTKDVWSQLPSTITKNAPEAPPIKGSADNTNLFEYGPTIGWIKSDSGGMTACGASGMSGAGSCA